jgi:hypothetical protein
VTGWLDASSGHCGPKAAYGFQNRSLKGLSGRQGSQARDRGLWAPRHLTFPFGGAGPFSPVEPPLPARSGCPPTSSFGGKMLSYIARASPMSRSRSSSDFETNPTISPICTSLMRSSADDDIVDDADFSEFVQDHSNPLATSSERTRFSDVVFAEQR